jgi:hypothetical protein
LSAAFTKSADASLDLSTQHSRPGHPQQLEGGNMADQRFETGVVRDLVDETKAIGEFARSEEAFRGAEEAGA